MRTGGQIFGHLADIQTRPNLDSLDSCHVGIKYSSCFKSLSIDVSNEGLDIVNSIRASINCSIYAVL